MLQVRAASYENFRFYHYDPSIAAAAVFIVLFALTTSLHAYQMFRTKTWFLIPFFIGGLFETIGYIGRIASAAQGNNKWTLGPYIIQTLFVLIAPALFAASIYMCLGRIVAAAEGDKYLFIRRKWLTTIFVTIDVLSFLVQSAGGGMLARASAENIELGQNLIVAGLFIQIVGFGLFVIASSLFHFRMQRGGTPRGYEVPWKKHMFALYGVSILILIRSIFRVIEYLQGQTGYLLTREVFLYVFDAALMFLAMLVLNWVHPSEIKSYLKGGPWTQGISMKQVWSGPAESQRRLESRA